MQNRPNADDQDERADDVPHTPDQDGPHDVPNDQVIEKTLPATVKKDRGEKPST